MKGKREGKKGEKGTSSLFSYSTCLVGLMGKKIYFFQTSSSDQGEMPMESGYQQTFLMLQLPQFGSFENHKRPCNTDQKSSFNFEEFEKNVFLFLPLIQSSDKIKKSAGALHFHSYYSSMHFTLHLRYHQAMEALGLKEGLSMFSTLITIIGA